MAPNSFTVAAGIIVNPADQGAKLAVFCTGPEIRSPVANLTTEIIGTAMLISLPPPATRSCASLNSRPKLAVGCSYRSCAKCARN